MTQKSGSLTSTIPSFRNKNLSDSEKFLFTSPLASGKCIRVAIGANVVRYQFDQLVSELYRTYSEPSSDKSYHSYKYVQKPQAILL